MSTIPTNRFLRTLSFCAAGFALLFGINPAWATTYVVTNLNDSGAGSLREAIEAAESNGEVDTIKFSVSGTITLGSTLPTITKPDGLTINGAGKQITISGNNAVRAIFVDAEGLLALGHLTISNGSFFSSGGGSGGGGVYNAGTLTATNCTFSHNHVERSAGGGIYNAGTLTVTSSTFSNNGAEPWGGAIYNAGTLTVTSSTFSSNTARNEGGGIDNIGTLTITKSTFISNASRSVGGEGGGIRNSGTLAVNTSTFSQNHAGNGGGISNGGSLTVTNCTVSDNNGYYGGGGIGNYSGTVTITSSTLSGNFADYGAGGIENYGGVLNMINTILANSTSGAPDCVNTGTLNPTGVNLVMDGSCNVSGALSVDPQLSPLADNGGPTLTHALLPESPAIDAADDSICTAPPVNSVDQRGVKRPQGVDCDLGAFEKGPDFLGFQPPVSNLPVLNQVKAGQSVPMKFFAKGNLAGSVFVASYPMSKQIDCQTDEPIDSPVASSNGQLTAGRNQYNFVWKTEKAWAGTCRQFQMLLTDGTYGQANFLFK